MGTGKWGQAVTILLLLGALAGLGMVVVENRSLRDRVTSLERQASAKPAPAPAKAAAPAPTPVVAGLPSGGTSGLEERIAALEKRAAGRVEAGAETVPSVASAPPVAKVTPSAAPGDPTAPAVSEDFKNAVLAVLTQREKEEKEAQKVRDKERGKMMAQGMADHQVQDLADKLQLSAAQKDQIAKIFKDGAEKVMSLLAPMWGGSDSGQPPDRDQIRQTIQQVTAEVDAQAKTLLTSEQATQYDAWRSQQNQQFGMFGGGRAIMVAPGSSSGPSTRTPGK